MSDNSDGDRTLTARPPSHGLPGEAPASTFRRIRRTLVPERVSRQILDLILAGRLQPGMKLPPEKQLIEALGVSRASVREALRALTVLGFVESRQGSGHFVRPARTVAGLEGQVGTLLAQQMEVLAVHEARRVLEPVVVALAAERSTKEDRRRMETVLRAYDAAFDRGEALFELGVQVHQAFAAGCHNPALIQLLRALSALIAPLQRGIYRRAGLVVREEDAQDHWSIYHAIAQRAPHQALELMVRHLGHVEDSLRQCILAAAQAALGGHAAGLGQPASPDAGDGTVLDGPEPS